MHRSISARILGGFLVMLVAFSGVMGYTFFRMHRLRQELMLTTSSYLELTLILAGLYTHQSNLLKTLEELRQEQHGTSRFLGSQLRFHRPFRRQQLRLARETARRSQLGVVAEPDRMFLHQVSRRLQQISRGFEENEPLFDRLISGAGAPAGDGAPMGQELLRQERRLTKEVRLLRNDLHGHVREAANRVQDEQDRAFWAILVMVAVALLVSVAVSLLARRTLRPLKGLVAGTKRIGSGDYSKRVEVTSEDELGVLAREFNNMAAAVEEREQALVRSERMAVAGRIASHITHEIRNPLSSVALNTELIEEMIGALQGESAEEARSLCQAIQQEVDRLTDLTEEYLRFSRLPRPQLQPEDLHELLAGLLSFSATELAGKQVSLQQDLQRGLPAVQADENQLRQAFLNLLRNAGEALAPRGGTLQVSARQEGDSVVVTFRDSGPGIQPEHLGKIFDPFFSTKETGTGLGLALTQQIITEHGGTIEVQSGAGPGTTFTVRLPALSPQPGAG